MSLVDYAASSEDEEAGEDERQHTVEGCQERREGKSESDLSAAAVIAPPRFTTQTKTESLSSTHRSRDVAMPSPALYMEKLPDASLLFSSSFSQHQCIGVDNYSRIASSMAERVSRKREPSGSSFIQLQNNKHPRGNLPHSRNIPDTVRGSLIPPQLKGRSNVVTEDIGRLFLNRGREPSTG
ncbi:hypothetical protein KSP39_PZI017660 [Platanthera zijinensis]|uniref:Uncharacterized protein n=1 Tax=Platanthera zijinensis TaxID=2320716 RepID=A0AAP0FZR5_9ASPA